MYNWWHNARPLFGNPPTGKPIVVTGFDLFRISNGKIKELWQQYNFASWQLITVLFFLCPF
jgi:hypothetical protein